MINFVLNSQVQPIEDVIEQSTANTERDEFLESSETAEIYRSRGASAEAAWDDDLPPPEEDESLEERFVDPESKDGQVFNMASKFVFDFRRGVGDHAERGDERTERNRELIPFAKQRLEEGRREAENMTPEQISAYGLDTAGSLNYNLTSAGIDFARIDDLPIDVRLGIATLLEMYERLPDGTWKGTQRFFGNMVQDPMLAVGGVGGFKVVQKLLKLGGGKALASKLLQSAARSAGYGAYAAEGSAYGAMSEYMMQRLAHDPEKGEFKPDYSKVFTVAAIGAVAAPAIAAAPAVARGVKNVVGPVVRDLFDAAGQSRSTVMSGVGPVPATAADEVSAPAPVFFSAVSNAVDALPMEKGSAQQMRAMIAKGEGVKPEEMAWTGLDDFLAGKKSVTKKEVRDYVDANQVQVEEVVRADEGVTQNVSYLRRRYEMMVEGSGDYADLPPSLREERAEKMLGDIEAMEKDNIVGPTKFGEYTLPGGENYREVLLRLPKVSGATISDTELARLNELTDKRIADSLGGLSDAERDEYITLVGKREDRGQFRTPHFDEPNVLAHMRLNDRTGPNGEKILFIEEIQSDWHQKGRKKGYQTPESTKHNAEIEDQIDDLMQRRTTINVDLSENFNLGGTGLPDGNGVRWYARDIIENNDYKNIGRVYENGAFYIDEGFSEANPAAAAKIKELSEIATEVGNLNRSKRTGSTVPDAPLKKTWHEMSFRRVARMAAEEGYDAIAWTPGKMQAERYDLSKQISELRVQKHNDGTVSFGYIPPEGGNRRMLRTLVPDNEIEDFLGKEMAEKIRGQNQETVDYSGVDLEVGSQGMKGFYDKILKNYAAKWGKKFGSKVGVTEVAADGPASVLEVVENEAHFSRLVTGESTFIVFDRTNGGQVADFRTQQEAQKYIENELADTKVWTLPVTKKMRDSVLKKGVPLFGAAGVAGGAATSDTSESPDI